MKYTVVAALMAVSAFSTAASAQKMNADDVKWINQCIDDNKGEPGATAQIVRAYCMCMNDKMDENETRSITQWEKSHPKERRECDRRSGWK